MPNVALYFSYKTLLDEVLSFEKILGNYLEDDASRILGNLRTTLSSAHAASIGTTTRWAISERWPLRTITSFGEYEPDQVGHGRRVFAAVNFLWELVRIVDPKYHFALGNASTVVRFMEVRDFATRTIRRPIGAWRFEFGVADSPGCFFHTSVNGIGVWFPRDLPIPRLHGLPISPFATIEYLIGELFQDRWALEAASKNSAMMDRWRAIQRARFKGYFDAMSSAVDGPRSTPLTRMKAWKPQASGLLGA